VAVHWGPTGGEVVPDNPANRRPDKSKPWRESVAWKLYGKRIHRVQMHQESYAPVN